MRMGQVRRRQSNAMHPIERILPRRLRAKITTARLQAFTEAAKQVKYSVLAVILVTFAEFLVRSHFDNINYQHQIEEKRLEALTIEIDKEIEMITGVVRDFRATEEILVNGGKTLSSTDMAEAIHNGGSMFRSIAETRRDLMAMYARISTVLSTEDANVIINLDPESSTVDHSERFNCSPDYLNTFEDKPSMYFHYYSAACMVGGTPIANTLTPDNKKGIQDFQKKNIENAFSHIEQFEISYSNIEYKLLKRIDILKKKRNDLIFRDR